MSIIRPRRGFGAAREQRRGRAHWENRGVSPDLSWSLEPAPIVVAVALAGAYVARRGRVRRAGGRAEDAPLWRLLCFLGAAAVALAALISPLDSLADDVFVMHMAQHVLLLDVVPILAIVGLTKVLLRPLTRSISDFER